MNTNLALIDPLADQDVTIIITLAANEYSRDQRPAMISVGVAEQLPMIKTGKFGEMAALINEAWTAFAVQAQVTEVAQEVKTVADEQLLAIAKTDDGDPAPTSQPHLSTPRPQARNLSLF